MRHECHLRDGGNNIKTDKGYNKVSSDEPLASHSVKAVSAVGGGGVAPCQHNTTVWASTLSVSGQRASPLPRMTACKDTVMRS